MFANSLKELRLQAGYTSQKDFAKAIPIRNNVISKLENGLMYFHSLNEEKQNRIAKLLNVSRHSLLVQSRMKDRAASVGTCTSRFVDKDTLEKELGEKYGRRLMSVNFKRPKPASYFMEEQIGRF